MAHKLLMLLTLAIPVHPEQWRGRYGWLCPVLLPRMAYLALSSPHRWHGSSTQNIPLPDPRQNSLHSCSLALCGHMNEKRWYDSGLYRGCFLHIILLKPSYTPIHTYHKIGIKHYNYMKKCIDSNKEKHNVIDSAVPTMILLQSTESGGILNRIIIHIIYVLGYL